MFDFLTKRIAVALVSGGVALGAMAVEPASAQYHHGYHGGYHHGGYYGHRHYYRGYGYGYGYGPGYYGGPYYGTPCVPVLGILSGNFCGY